MTAESWANMKIKTIPGDWGMPISNFLSEFIRNNWNVGLKEKNFIVNRTMYVVTCYITQCGSVITTITNTRNGRFGKATCRRGDTFNASLGLAIAWARYNHENIPEDVKMSCDFKTYKNGDRFNFNYCNYTFVGAFPSKDNTYVVVNDETGNIETISF